jgi:hypothetical protein
MSARACVLCAVLLTGCASAQLNYNTLDLAASLGDLYTKQALINLSRIIDDRDALPSQLDINGGVVQTNFTVTPNTSGPISHSVARTAAGAVSSTTLAGAVASLNMSNSSQQNWSVSPVSDANSLRNLRALYLYAVGYDGTLADYYIPYGVDDNGKPVPDKFFTKQPHCVKCEDGRINSKLGRPGWLYWTTDPGVPVEERLPPSGERVIELGHFGNHTLMVLEKEKRNLSNFVLFTMPVAPESSGQKGKKGPSGKKGPTFAPFSQPLPSPPQ